MENFPAEVDVPFDRRMEVEARSRGARTFQRTIVLSTNNPREDLSIRLQTDPFGVGFGIRTEDLPQDSGLDREATPPGRRPVGPLFRSRRGSPWGPSGGVIVDRNGDVWSYQRTTPHTDFEYQFKGRVRPTILSQIRGLMAEALDSDLVALGSTCYDCGGSTVEVALDNREKPEVLAQDGETFAKRDCPAAETLLRWFSAVCRDAFDPFGER